MRARFATGRGLVKNHQFYLASRDAFATKAEGVRAMLAELQDLGPWAEANRDAAVDTLTAETKIARPAIARTFERTPFAVRPLDDAIVAEQQRIADTFFELGIVPKRVVIADAVPPEARGF